MFHETMTPSERIESLHETGWADRPGISAIAIGVVAKMAGNITVGECYKDPVQYARAFYHVQELFGFDSGPFFGHAASGAAEFGGKLAYPNGSKAQFPVITKRPINKLEDVDSIEVPDPAKAGEIPKNINGAKYVMENYPLGYRNPILVTGDSFTWAGNIIGVETMLMWMQMDPDAVHKILSMVAEFEAELVGYALGQLGDIMFFDASPSDSNDIINATQFKQFALPPLISYRTKSMKMGASRFIAHPCGDQTKNIAYWGQVPGTYSINFDFRTPLELCVDTLGKRMTIAGNIESAQFMLGDYDWLYRKAYEKLSFAAKRSRKGYMVGPGCELPVNTPPLNLMTIVQATRDYAASDEWKAMNP